MFIFRESLSDRLLELNRPPVFFGSSSFPDFESLAREMEVLSLSREVSGSSRLNPTYVNHLQSVSPFHCFDLTAESIEECLMSVDDMSLRA